MALSLVEDVAPAFEKQTGIKIDFTLLPIDALNARLKSELNSGSSGIDIVQWTSQQIGWLYSHLEDHEKLLAGAAGKHADFDWDDFLPAIREMAIWDSKLSGIPYRVTMGVLHYQKALLEQVGFVKAPETFAELQQAAIETTKAGASANRYGMGYLGRQGPAIVDCWCRSCAPTAATSSTRRPARFTSTTRGGGGAGVLRRPDDEIPGRRARSSPGNSRRSSPAVRTTATRWQTLTPYGTLINDATKSKTGGRWAWATMPGASRQARVARSSAAGACGRSAGKHKEWAFEFIQMACSKQWMQRSMLRGNAPPRVSVLNDPEMVHEIRLGTGSAAALKTALLDPRDASGRRWNCSCAAGFRSIAGTEERKRGTG